MKLRIVFVMLMLASALTAACAGSAAAGTAAEKSAAGGTSQIVEVKALDTMKFEPATLTVQSGTPVRLTLVNNGAVEHNWVVANLDGRKVQVDARPRAGATVEFTPTTPGTYEYFCSLPGHREAGMKGTLIVQ